jgi:rubrerythrin
LDGACASSARAPRSIEAKGNKETEQTIMKQYTERPEKYEELAHTPRDTDSIAAVPGFYPASQFVFRTRFDASTGQTVEERYEEPVYCRTCHELLWSDSRRPKPIGSPQQLVHKDGSSVMMLCHACGYRAAPTPPPRLCPQCGVDRAWGNDHSAQPEPPFHNDGSQIPHARSGPVREAPR